ncbi:MAG: patatin-like phospholipase family protein [Deltaproteobacteria bacterium]|nr:patatin-like phospholipase family protein [Deltaproteobacteria bacterium]
MAMKMTGKKVALALGGGGVRGFAHLGVLKVLEEERIDIDLIAGTSAGALIGGAYAAGLSPRKIQKRIDDYLASPEFRDSELKSIGTSMCPDADAGSLTRFQMYLLNQYYMLRSFFRLSVLPAREFTSLIDHFIPDMDIRQTRVPLLVVATDLLKGQKIVFSEGPLRQAVLASCSVPGAVEPFRWGEWLLADGGITSLVPVQAAREAGADMVIAVVVEREIEEVPQLETARDVFYRAGEITADRLQDEELREADVVIRPSLGDVHWMNYSGARDLVRKGEEATREALGRIEGALPFFKRSFRFASRLIPSRRRKS